MKSRTHIMAWGVSAAAILMATHGCKPELPPGQGAPVSEGAALAQPPLRETFEGYIIPTNATVMRAPENTFRAGNMQMDSPWIKLQDFPEDGKEVKQGEVVGKFEFRGKQAHPVILEQIQRAEADRERASLDVDDTIQKMRTEEERLGLDAERAELDTRKEGLVSGRDLERFHIARSQADFEASAQTKQLSAYRRSVRAEGAYYDQRLKVANQDMTRYGMYEGRFTVKAPHDGVVRHAFYKRRQRKIQKGDGMPAGMHFVSVARDDALSLQFFIPEDRYDLTRTQKQFVVLSPTSSKTYAVEVERVDEFPQELGFLRENDALPGAREKMYVVHARFGQKPEGLSAGLEVKVRLP